jgi:hypothetical protein
MTGDPEALLEHLHSEKDEAFSVLDGVMRKILVHVDLDPAVKRARELTMMIGDEDHQKPKRKLNPLPGSKEVVRSDQFNLQKVMTKMIGELLQLVIQRRHGLENQVPLLLHIDQHP